MAPKLSPAEALIERKLRSYLAEGYSQRIAMTRTANELGLSRARIVRVWVLNRLQDNE